MSKRDFYEVLGCAKSASIDEIKGAYRKLAKELHPDRNPGDHECEHRFKEINEAYDVLKDGDKRAAYDRFGHAAFESGGGRGANGFGFDFAFVLHRRLRRSVRRIHGRPPRAAAEPRRRSPIQSRNHARRSLRAASNAQIRVNAAVPCEACGGAGAEAGSRPEQCPTCSGAGKVRAQQGFFTIERTWPIAGAAGASSAIRARPAVARGHVQKERTLSVSVPAGVEEGTRIRLAGEGQAGLNGGPPGDLYIFISIAPASDLPARRATISIAARRCRS